MLVRLTSSPLILFEDRLNRAFHYSTNIISNNNCGSRKKPVATSVYVCVCIVMLQVTLKNCIIINTILKHHMIGSLVSQGTDAVQ